MYITIKITLVSIGMIAIAAGFMNCTKEKVHGRENAMSSITIQEVLKTNTPDLMSIPGVVGTAIGEQNDELCIKILVIEKTPELMKNIPSTLEGFPVSIKETGEIMSLDKP